MDYLSSSALCGAVPSPSVVCLPYPLPILSAQCQFRGWICPASRTHRRRFFSIAGLLNVNAIAPVKGNHIAVKVLLVDKEHVEAECLSDNMHLLHRHNDRTI